MIGHNEPADPKLVEKQVAEALNKILKSREISEHKKKLPASKSSKREKK